MRAARAAAGEWRQQPEARDIFVRSPRIEIWFEHLHSQIPLAIECIYRRLADRPARRDLELQPDSKLPAAPSKAAAAAAEQPRKETREEELPLTNVAAFLSLSLFEPCANEQAALVISPASRPAKIKSSKCPKIGHLALNVGFVRPTRLRTAAWQDAGWQDWRIREVR